MLHTVFVIIFVLQTLSMGISCSTEYGAIVFESLEFNTCMSIRACLYLLLCLSTSFCDPEQTS